MTQCLIEKKCSKCSTICPATSEYFYRDRNGLRAECKKCSKKIAKQRIKDGYKAPGRTQTLHKYNNSDKGKAAQLKYRRTKKGKSLTRRAKLKYYYNMSNDDYNQLFQQQNGQCAICGEHQSKIKRRLDIDHDHRTNKIRGLLCRPCNQHLGRFEKGYKFNSYFTQKFTEYLEIAPIGHRERHYDRR